MKKKTVFLVTLGMMILTGCGGKDVITGQTSGGADEAGIVSEDSVEGASGSARGEAASGDTNEDVRDGGAVGYTINVPKELQYTWQECTFTLPEEWVGRCIMEENEFGFSVYQKVSYERDDTSGYICGFFRTEEPVEYDHGKIIVAYTEDGTLYYMVQPTDVACETEEEEIVGEYIRMCQQVPQLKTSLQIAVPGVHGHADEYMLPTSSIFPLDPAMLAGMSDNFLWIAKNEIYARHGRLFTNEYLQQYFNRCSWYDGVILPEEFQGSILNRTESDNLQLLAAAREEYDRQHPYPKRYPASETAWEDLDGDGTLDEVSYRVTEQEGGVILCMLTVNGEMYVANMLSDTESDAKMTNPTEECFYITDILESDGILEIAVLDEGPSEDPVTYFFQYDGTLSCIGQISGFPFADMNGGVNGFDGYGGISGCSRIDLIETAYLRDRWWYDGSRIIDLGLGWCDFLPSLGHTLYEDLPVYCEQDETAASAVIPAQEEVFFLGTDREQWILVKGKDGSQGYMLIKEGNVTGLGKPADQVFSGLQFSD